MKRTSLLSFLLLSFAVSFVNYQATAQVSVYKTYNDYLKKSGLLFTNVKHKRGKLFFKEANGSESSFKASELWGFSYNDEVIRCDENGVYFVSLHGAVIVYTNALDYIYQLNGSVYNCGCLHPEDLPSDFISNDLNSEVYATHFTSMNTDFFKPSQKKYKAFVSTYPQHKLLYDCIGDSYRTEEFLRCAYKYNCASSLNLRFDSTNIDLGSINVKFSERDIIPPLKTEFKFVNTSKDTITIKKISSQVVSGADWTFFPQSIPPGGKGIIYVSLKTSELDKGTWGKRVPKGKYTLEMRTSANVFHTAESEPLTLAVSFRTITTVE